MGRKRGSWLTRWSRRLTAGKLALGRGRRARRSQRLKQYAAAAALPATPGLLSRLLDLLRHRWATVVLVWLAALLVYLAFGTSWFYIYNVEVSGTRRVSEAELYNRSQLEALSLFWLNPRAVAARLERDPIIARAVVSALPPNRVRLQVQEREPVVVWQSGAQSLFADGEGVLFGLRGDASEMLVVRDLRAEPVEPGARVDAVAVRTARELHHLLPERRAFDWEPGLGLSFVTEAGWKVVFGDHTRLATKLAAFEAFRAQPPPDKEILLLDLSVPEHPYYRWSPLSQPVSE